jgi:hypothetical protein
MRLLLAKSSESVVTDDRLGPEVLELGGVSAGVGREVDQLQCAIQGSVVVRTDVRNEIGWRLRANSLAAQEE